MRSAFWTILIATGRPKTAATAALTIAALAFPIEGVSAATILYGDGFHRSSSNTVGNGWTELEHDSDDVSIIEDDYMILRDSTAGLQDAAAASRLIDATGYKNLIVSFRWRALAANEADDIFHVAYAFDPAPAISDVGAWTEIYSNGYDDIVTRVTHVALGSIADNSMLNLLLWSDVSETDGGDPESDVFSGDNEGFKIAWVRVTGEKISAIPLPASLPLLIGGLFGFGFAARRRRKS